MQFHGLVFAQTELLPITIDIHWPVYTCCIYNIYKFTYTYLWYPIGGPKLDGFSDIFTPDEGQWGYPIDGPKLDGFSDW